MTEVYEKALRQVDQQIAEKTRKRDQLSAEIVQLQAARIGLQRALGQQMHAETAWTELAMAVLNSNRGRALSAAEVRDVLLSWGYAFTGINNPLAFINTCLQRLADRGQIGRTKTGRPFRFNST